MGQSPPRTHPSPETQKQAAGQAAPTPTTAVPSPSSPWGQGENPMLAGLRRSWGSPPGQGDPAAVSRARSGAQSITRLPRAALCSNLRLPQRASS